MAREANSFSLLLRYQAQAERHYRRAIEEFDRLKALREELPIEPITEPDLEATETTYPAPPTNPNSPGKTSLQACQAGEQPQSNVNKRPSLNCAVLLADAGKPRSSRTLGATLLTAARLRDRQHRVRDQSSKGVHGEPHRERLPPAQPLRTPIITTGARKVSGTG
jgi:hypothetical protein